MKKRNEERALYCGWCGDEFGRYANDKEFQKALRTPVVCVKCGTGGYPKADPVQCVHARGRIYPSEYFENQ